MQLQIKNITKSYGKNRALSDFTATLEPGIYALLGPNGSGKSTLMNILTDDLPADSGEILFADGNSSGEPRKVFPTKKIEQYQSTNKWRYYQNERYNMKNHNDLHVIRTIERIAYSIFS